jgi:methionyl-tRNA formyltransferase
MIVTVLITDVNHPIMEYLNKWAKIHRDSGRDVSIIHDVKDLNGGDFLFLVSCAQILKTEDIRKFTHALVLHASDLPEGRGWSPHIWRVLEGESKITVSVLDAVASVDKGDIWLQTHFELEGHELFDEINKKLFEAELNLMTSVITTHKKIAPIPQKGIGERYYRKRAPSDSFIDLNKPISEQFNLLRVCDPNRFPAYFEYLGHKYQITVRKIQDDK